MIQIEMFPPTEQEIISELHKTKVELGSMRRAAFAQISELRKDYEFLQDQLEVILDLLNEKSLDA